MFEGLKGKEVKCVFHDADQDKAIIGRLVGITSKFLKIMSRTNNLAVFVSINSIVSVFEREDEQNHS